MTNQKCNLKLCAVLVVFLGVILALAGGCDYRRVSTAIPYLRTLGGFLVERVG